MSAAPRLIDSVAIPLVLVATLTAAPALADEQQGAPSSSGRSVATIGKFLGGAAVGLGMHEAGHLILDFALDADPGVRRVSFAKVPFFAITHRPMPPGREFAISSAGFWVQEGSNEFLFARHPRLRDDQAPFVKGLLAFNILASVAYGGTALARYGPDERDTRGMALSADVDERVIGVTLLIPAALDGARYYKPEWRWLPWVSRGAKIATAMLILKTRADSSAAKNSF